MKYNAFIKDYIRLRELQFIKEVRYYCSDIKEADKRCIKQCEKCKDMVDEKINDK